MQVESNIEQVAVELRLFKQDVTANYVHQRELEELNDKINSKVEVTQMNEFNDLGPENRKRIDKL